MRFVEEEKKIFLWFRLISLALLLLLNLACGKKPRASFYFDPNKSIYENPEVLTGMLNDEGIPYVKDPKIPNNSNTDNTNQAHKGHEQSLKSDLKNLELSGEIKKIDLFRFAKPVDFAQNLENLKANAVTFGQEAILFELEVLNLSKTNNLVKLNFEINNIERLSSRTIKFVNIQAKEDNNFTLTGTIEDSVAGTSFLGSYSISKKNKKGQPLTVKFYQRKYFAQTIVHNDQLNTATENKFYNVINSNKLFAWVSNWTFPNSGPAYRKIQFLLNSDANITIDEQLEKNAILKTIDKFTVVVEYEYPAIRTAGLSVRGYPLEAAGKFEYQEILNTFLVGQDEVEGDQMYLFEFLADSKVAIAKTYLEVKELNDVSVNLGSIKKQEVTTSKTNKYGSQGRETNLFKSFYDKMDVSDVVLNAIKDLDKNKNILKVKEILKYWTEGEGKKPYKSIKSAKTVNVFLRNIRPLKNEIAAIFSSFDSPPEMSFPTLVENNFFTSDNYSFKPVNSMSTAAGMYQIILKTADYNGLLVDMSQKKGMIPRPFDERLYFYPASCAVARMMNHYINKFKFDATLAFLSFRIGSGATASIVSCSQAKGGKTSCHKKQCTTIDCLQHMTFLEHTNLKYSDLEKYNILPVEISSWMNQILALYFIARDLKTYGFASDYIKNKPSKKILMPPNKQIKDRVCNDIVAGFSN